MATIYAGNLPLSATEADLRALFETHGAVQLVKRVNDRETGRPPRVNEARARGGFDCPVT